jgi:hypothetical protein
VPWGLKRFQQSGQTHFVTFCCYRRRPLFTAAASQRIFEVGLERVRRGFGLCVYGYVRAEDWQWSSFLQYATGCEGRVEIESEWAARKRERAAGRLVPAVELPHSSQKQA